MAPFRLPLVDDNSTKELVKHGFDLDLLHDTLSMVCDDDDDYSGGAGVDSDHSVDDKNNPSCQSFLHLFYSETLRDLMTIEEAFKHQSKDHNRPDTSVIGQACHRLLGRFSQLGWTEAVAQVQIARAANKVGQMSLVREAIKTLFCELDWFSRFIDMDKLANQTTS